MPAPTKEELKNLESFERRHHDSYHFQRETPRNQRDIPFAEETPQSPSWRELLVWFLLWGGFLGFLFFVLHLTPEAVK